MFKCNQSENSPVPYSKYVTLVLLNRRHDNTKETLSAMFAACDETKCGLVAETDIQQLLRMLGYRETGREIRDMVMTFDMDNDGKLNKAGTKWFNSYLLGFYLKYMEISEM
jgi:Ca2+-binding EF-hand superfamily protein